MSSHKSQASSSRKATSTDRAFECIICMEVLVNPRVLPCGHSYCSSPKNCLSEALKVHTPPQCASCNAKLPAEIREEDVPKNYALSSAIEVLKTSAKKSRDACPTCPEHGKKQDLYCKPCDVLVCKKCWKADHSMGNHEVVLFSSTQEPFKEVKIKLVKCKEEAEKLMTFWASGVEQCSELLSDIQNTEKSLEAIIYSTNPVDMNKHFGVLRSTFSASTSKIESMSAKFVTEQIDVVRSQLSETSNFPSCANLNPLVDRRASLEEPTIHKKPLTLDTENIYDLALIDTAEESVFLYSGGTTTITVYKIDWDYRRKEKKMELNFSVQDMRLVNDNLVILSFIDPVIKVTDKKSFKRLETINLLHDTDYIAPRSHMVMDGYADKLALVGFNEYTDQVSMAQLCLFRGTNFELFATDNVEAIYDGKFFDFPVAFCNKESFLIKVDRFKLCIFNFNQQQITTKRFITLDDAINSISYLTNPAWPPYQGILVVETETAGSLRWCKFDERSVESGDTIPTFVLNGFGEREWKVTSSSNTPKALVRCWKPPYEYYILSLS